MAEEVEDTAVSSNPPTEELTINERFPAEKYAEYEIGAEVGSGKDGR